MVRKETGQIFDPYVRPAGMLHTSSIQGFHDWVEPAAELANVNLRSEDLPEKDRVIIQFAVIGEKPNVGDFWRELADMQVETMKRPK